MVYRAQLRCLPMTLSHRELYRNHVTQIIILQQDLNYVSDWSKLWLLKFNASKCSVMHLGRNDKATYTLFNQTTNSNISLHPTTEQKQLGVWITPTMNFSVHCHRAASKANQALGMVKRNFKHLSKCSLVLYKTFDLEYCAPIWSPHYCKDIDTLEKCREGPQSLFQLFLHLVMNLD